MNRISGGQCDLELYRALRLVLHHHGAACNLVAVADVPDLEADEVAATKLAVNSQIEEGELAHSTFHLESNTKGPDIFELERCLLTDDFALVPWLTMTGIGFGSHDGLPSS